MMGRRTGFATGLLATLLACDSSTGPGPDPIPAPAQVQVAGGNGQTGAPSGLLADSLSVKVVYADGQPAPQATVVWRVSAGGGTLSAASSTTDAAGMAKVAWTLGAAGPNAATATVGALPAAAFAAYAVPVASVTLSSQTVRVGKGESTQLVATPRDSTGAPLAGRTVVWTTSSAATAAVSDSGRVTGRAQGTATVTATSEGRSASAGVTVTLEDRTPPHLAGLAFSPGQVDVTAEARTVEFSVHATDGGSGVTAVLAGFDPPVTGYGAWCLAADGGDGGLVSGTAEDGVWRCSVTVPMGAVPGTWPLPQVILSDAAGNQVGYPAGELAAAGHPNSLTVVNTAPPAAPALTALAFSPTVVNVEDDAATVEVTFAATAGAGVRETFVRVQAARAQPAGAVTRGCTSTTRVAGTSTAGTWKCSLVIPRHALGGPWEVSTAWVADGTGRATQYTRAQLAALEMPVSFQVVSPAEDAEAPTLTGVSVTPSTVDLSGGPASVEVTLTATDAGTGLAFGSSLLRSPAGGAQNCTAGPGEGSSPHDATVICTIGLPAVGAAGAWSLEVTLRDQVGNLRIYTAQQLRDAGFVYEVTVIH
jgi:hypothetical protein